MTMKHEKCGIEWELHTLSSMTLRLEQFSKSAIFVSMLTCGTEFYNQSYNIDK